MAEAPVIVASVPPFNETPSVVPVRLNITVFNSLAFIAFAVVAEPMPLTKI